MAQEVELLPSKFKTPVLPKKKNENNNRIPFLVDFKSKFNSICTTLRSVFGV
jgi:hypothetical protein